MDIAKPFPTALGLVHLNRPPIIRGNFGGSTVGISAATDDRTSWCNVAAILTYAILANIA
jgi:hypothetical protein